MDREYIETVCMECAFLDDCKGDLWTKSRCDHERATERRCCEMVACPIDEALDER